MLCVLCFSSLSIEECHNILPCERTSTSLTELCMQISSTQLLSKAHETNDSAACRYQNPDKQVVDIVKHSDQHWELRLYNRGNQKMRTVDMFFNRNAINPGGFHVPNRLKLTSHGYLGYTLDMDLIEAVPLTP